MNTKRNSKQTQYARNSWPSCEICGQPVASDGLLMLRKADYNRALEEYMQHRPIDGRLLQAHWYWCHAECSDPDLRYAIEAARIDTADKALRWYFHMGTKNGWLRLTDFHVTLRRLFPEMTILP